MGRGRDPSSHRSSSDMGRKKEGMVEGTCHGEKTKHRMTHCPQIRSP